MQKRPAAAYTKVRRQKPFKVDGNSRVSCEVHIKASPAESKCPVRGTVPAFI